MARLLIAVLLITAGTCAFAQKPPSNTPQKTNAASAARDADDDDLAALRSDLEHMRTTLYQMQTNLAFVGSTTTPLYHEFELNISMWQVMIGQMQRRLDRLEHAPGAGASRENK